MGTNFSSTSAFTSIDEATSQQCVALSEAGVSIGNITAGVDNVKASGNCVIDTKDVIKAISFPPPPCILNAAIETAVTNQQKTKQKNQKLNFLQTNISYNNQVTDSSEVASAACANITLSNVSVGNVNQTLMVSAVVERQCKAHNNSIPLVAGNNQPVTGPVVYHVPSGKSLP